MKEDLKRTKPSSARGGVSLDYKPQSPVPNRSHNTELLHIPASQLSVDVAPGVF